MLATLPLKDMTLGEKFMTMEMLWDDICHNSPDFKSPAWHKNILIERDKKIASGEDKLIDWEEAKTTMRTSTK